MAVIKRSIEWDKDGKPIMILAPAMRDNRKRYVIGLNEIWKYSEDHNPQFENFLANRCLQLCQLFNIDVPQSKHTFVQLMSKIEQVIMEGIDDLVKMPPNTPRNVPDPTRPEVVTVQ